MSTTVGASVSTLNVTCSLVPSSFPSPLFSVAFAVNVCLPGASALLNPLVDQCPPDAVVLALATSSVPRGGVDDHFGSSLAVPANDGFTLFDRSGGAVVILTSGRAC